MKKTVHKKRSIRIKRKPSVKKSRVKEINTENEFEKRKLELKRKRRLQRFKRKLIILAFFAAAAAVTVIIFKAPFFNISEIVCVGYEHISEEELIKQSGVQKGANIFVTNLGNVKQRISDIPYVSESNSRRIFPNKIKIWIRECTPAFAVKEGNKFKICDSNSKVLEIADENAENLCCAEFSESVEAAEGELLFPPEDKKNARIIECIKALENSGMLNLTSGIDFTDISDIIILYDGRLKIRIGNASDISYKLKFISEVIKNNISEFEKATVDYTGEKLYVSQFEDERSEKEQAKNNSADESGGSDKNDSSDENRKNNESLKNNENGENNEKSD